MKFAEVGRLVLLVNLMVGAAACQGVVPGAGGGRNNQSDGEGGSGGVPGERGGGGKAGSLYACNPEAAASTPKRLWRLSPLQYRNTIATLFDGRDAAAATSAKRVSPFEDGSGVDRFSTFARSPVVNDLDLGRVMSEAASVAQEYLGHIEAPGSSCTNLSGSCAFAAVQEAAEKLFRRPLQPVEVTQYQKMLTDGRALLGDEQGLALVVESLLLAPSFLYRVELGEAKANEDGLVRLSAFETASAISYSLTDAPPDEALWKAAKANELASASDIRAQVERLVASPAHQGAVLRFLKEYFRYDTALDVFKDEKLFPFHDAVSLVDDTDKWLAQVYQQAGHEKLLETLFTFDQVFARGSTAANYNMDGQIDPKAAPKLAPAPVERVGMLTQPSFLTALSHSDSTDPVRRGRFVAENFLCVDIPSLPIGLVPELPEPTLESTLRDRLQQHVEDPSCNACHKMMDPIGFGFEGYDHLGRVRPTEGGKPVNAQGELVGGQAQEGPFDGVPELARKLAASSLVSECFVRHGFSFWMGRQAEDADGCALQTIHESFVQSGQDHVALLTSLFSSDSFLLRRP